MQHKYNIELIRFTTTGSYFDTITFATDSGFILTVIDEIEAAYSAGDIAQSLDYLITGVGFPYNRLPTFLKLASDREHLESINRYLLM